MAQSTKTQQSLEPDHRTPLAQMNWESVDEPGAYVELGTGDLYRMPKEALMAGASPIVIKESRGASRLARISTNPFVTTLEARLTCAQHNIEANF
jgi:hypothetical protein